MALTDSIALKKMLEINSKITLALPFFCFSLSRDLYKLCSSGTKRIQVLLFAVL